MENTSIRCYLNLSANLDQIDFQKQKFDVYKIPDNEYRFVRTRKDFGLELFDTGLLESLFTEEILVIVINKIKKFLPEFNFNVDNLNYKTARIEVVIHIYNGEIPSIYLDKEVINFLNKIGVEIQFDMYCF